MAAVSLHDAVATLVDRVAPRADGQGMTFTTGPLIGPLSPELVATAVCEIRKVLSDETVTTSDLKGALNRASSRTWGMEYPDVADARAYLTTLLEIAEAFLRTGKLAPW